MHKYTHRNVFVVSQSHFVSVKGREWARSYYCSENIVLFLYKNKCLIIAFIVRKYQTEQQTLGDSAVC